MKKYMLIFVLLSSIIPKWSDKGCSLTSMCSLFAQMTETEEITSRTGSNDSGSYVEITRETTVRNNDDGTWHKYYDIIDVIYYDNDDNLPPADPPTDNDNTTPPATDTGQADNDNNNSNPPPTDTGQADSGGTSDNDGDGNVDNPSDNIDKDTGNTDQMDDQLDDQYQDNTSTVNGKPSDLTDAQKQAKINSLVQDLNTKIKANCPTCPLVPNAVYTPNYPGWGQAVLSFNKDDHSKSFIIIPESFFAMTSDGNRESDIYHEYHHFVDDSNSINYYINDSRGHVFEVETNTKKVVSDDEYLYYYKKGLNEALTTPAITEGLTDPTAKNNKILAWAKETGDAEKRLDYTYKPSNYFREEIAARKAELQGEKDGFYKLTDAYRQERMEQIQLFEWDQKRAEDYEKAKTLKPDGNHQ